MPTHDLVLECDKVRRTRADGGKFGPLEILEERLGIAVQLALTGGAQEAWHGERRQDPDDDHHHHELQEREAPPQTPETTSFRWDSHS